MSYVLSVNNCSGYYLDHRLLVNKGLLSNTTETEVYELKSEIFLYTEKINLTDDCKRKRKKPVKTSPLDNESKDLENIKNNIETLLTECQQYIPPVRALHTENITSILEATTDFPTLRGANNLEISIVTKVTIHEVIIPPKCIFYNDDIRNLSNIISENEKLDLIVLDPPWRNKYIRRLKSARAELSYSMLYNEELSEIPIEKYIHENTLVVIWCTNSNLHHKAIIETFLPKWNLKFLAKWYWVKLNHKGGLVCPVKDQGQKQPFEHLFLATHQNNSSFNFKEEFVISVASTIHSHKPPLFEIFKQHLPEDPKCLELFARYLYPGFTSIGLEVLKLQDIRLYNLKKEM